MRSTASMETEMEIEMGASCDFLSGFIGHTMRLWSVVSGVVLILAFVYCRCGLGFPAQRRRLRVMDGLEVFGDIFGRVGLERGVRICMGGIDEG